MSSAARKELLLEAAREVFADKGYAASGLNEIAARAGVNKRLLYYYYSDGRPELFTAVLNRLAGELANAIHDAVSVPFHSARRVERLVRALTTFFEQQPDAFNLLFRDPFGVRDDDIVSQGAHVQSELAREFTILLAPSGAPVEVLFATASGAVAYVIRVIEMQVGRQISTEEALDACLTCLLGVMTQLGIGRA